MLLVRGDLTGARAVMNRASSHTNLLLLKLLRETLLADIETMLGRPNAALGLLQDYRDSDHLAVLVALPRARAFLALRDWPRAQHSVRSVLTATSTLVSRYSLLEAMLFDAQIAQLKGDQGRALEMISSAIELAQGDIVLPFFAVRGVFAPLLARHPAVAAQWPLSPASVPVDAVMPGGRRSPLIFPTRSPNASTRRCVSSPPACRRPRSPTRCAYRSTRSRPTWPRFTGSSPPAGGKKRCCGRGNSSCSEARANHGHSFRMKRTAAIYISVGYEKSWSNRKKNLVPPRYEIRIAGQLDSTAAAAFAGLTVIACGRFTVIGESSKSGLHGVLEKIRSLGLDLVDVRRVRGSPGDRRGIPVGAAGSASPQSGDPCMPDSCEHGLVAALIKEAFVTGRTYEIRVVGSLGPAASQAFADVALEVEPTATVLCGDLDQAGLHALLDRVRALGLELVDIRQVPCQSFSLPSARAQTSSSPSD